MSAARHKIRALLATGVALLVTFFAGPGPLRGATPTTTRAEVHREPLLVFCALTDENWDLYAWDLHAAHAATRLTQTPFDEMMPSLAPDHSHVIYQTSDGRLWRLNLARGSTPQPLPFGSKQEFDMHPAIAPDSNRVAMATSLDRRSDDTDLIVYNQIIREFEAPLELISYQHFPAWSPDGRWLAFSNLHARSTTGITISEIWMMRPDHQGLRQLTLLDAYSISPRWSPDGKRVAFASNAAGDFNLWTVDVQSRRMKQLTNGSGSDTSPVYSPDGKSILFVSTRGGDLGLWELREGSSSPRPVLPFGAGAARPCKDPDLR